MTRIAYSILIFVLLVLPAQAEAVRSLSRQLISRKAPQWSETSTGPFCGVFAACNAIRLLGIDAEESKYVTSKYVGSCGGSSVKEICAIVEDAGGRACQRTQLSAYDIRVFGGPVIAYVRGNPTSDRFNHWIVAVAHNGGVMTYDGLDSPRVISMAEFLGVWSGLGILVSHQDENPAQLLLLSRATMVLMCGVAVALIGPGVSRIRMRLEVLNSGLQVAAIVGVTTIAAIIGSLVFGDLKNYSEGRKLATAHTHGEVSTGTLNDALRAAANPAALLIDARRQQDFLLGTIPSAINIPVDASSWEIREYLSDIDKSTCIVVFCQSASCKYDESVAQQLAGLGFSNVTISDQGWREYSIRSKRGEAGVQLNSTK